MLPDFSKLYHLSSKNHSKGHQPIPAKSSDWPEEWRTTFYKTYPRFSKVELGTPSVTLAAGLAEQRPDFFDLVKKRQSRRNFTLATMSLQELSTLLAYSCGNVSSLDSQRSRRAHPSGGGRFPIEIYPLIFRGGEVPAGLYHYNVKEHALDVLWQREFDDTDIAKLFTYEWAKGAAAILVMTAVFWRNQNKYGERGYRYILLEAGHIGQNIYLASEALGLKCCGLTGMRDEALEELIDIDGISESVIYALAIGR